MFKHLDYVIPEIKTETIDRKRYYVTPSGEKYPSITTVLGHFNKKGILEWRKRVGEKEANRISTQASRRGTKVHQMCEDFINNKLDENKFMPTDKETFNSLRNILTDNINNIHCQEASLYSDYLKVAGRVDCVAEWNNRLSVIDFKTSRKLKKKEYISNYFQQGAAYCVMYEERTKIPVDQLIIVIAVDGESPQIFIEKRDTWVLSLMKKIKLYGEENGKEGSRYV
jgi:genome maintenance exonuclease 1